MKHREEHEKEQACGCDDDDAKQDFETPRLMPKGQLVKVLSSRIQDVTVFWRRKNGNNDIDATPDLVIIF